MPAIFARSEPPASHRAGPIDRYARWHTWSPAFRHFIESSEPWLRRLPEPKLVRIPGLGEYGRTFTLTVEPRAELAAFARALCRLRRPAGIMLFTGLMGDPLDGHLLRRLFALLRANIASILGDRRFSLYAPLGVTGARAHDFALHSDLYMPQLLFNVFEEVPADGSGASTFLPTRIMSRLMEQLESLPPRVRSRFDECYRRASRGDRFNALYELLYGSELPWADALQAAMQSHRLSIVMAAGEGYLIHDRTWLHGREAPSGGVPRRRLHRLVFNTLAMQRQVTDCARL